MYMCSYDTFSGNITVTYVGAVRHSSLVSNHKPVSPRFSFAAFLACAPHTVYIHIYINNVYICINVYRQVCE